MVWAIFSLTQLNQWFSFRGLWYNFFGNCALFNGTAFKCVITDDKTRDKNKSRQKLRHRWIEWRRVLCISLKWQLGTNVMIKKNIFAQKIAKKRHFCLKTKAKLCKKNLVITLYFWKLHINIFVPMVKLIGVG
jgi:hypothetical protein